VSAGPCYNNCMPNVHSPEVASYVLQILVSAFLAVLFLQSGIDKVVDRRGNREYLNQHFARSPLAGTVGPMFVVITILEVSAGALSGVGCALLLLTHDSTVAYLGAVVGGVNIVALFFGQRVAKDYAGAAALVPYFLLALTAIYLLAEH
jgi:diacylglycerol kinase